MSNVWGMLLQWGTTIKVSIELPVATRHRHDMTEKFLKATLNPNKQQEHGHTSMLNEPPDDKINKMACAPSEDSDQPGHPPSLIRVFAVLMKKAWVLSYPLSTQRRPWSDWANVQADLSLRLAHSYFVDFVMRRLTHRDSEEDGSQEMIRCPQSKYY